MKTINFFIALFFLKLAPAMAQHQHGAGEHKHSSPHGGTVKSAGNYHLELLQKDGGLTVYLLDAAEKPMAVAGASATALLQTADGKVTTLKLAPTGPQQFSVIPDKTKSFRKAIVNVSVKGQTASASFDLATASAGTGQAASKH